MANSVTESIRVVDMPAIRAAQVSIASEISALVRTWVDQGVDHGVIASVLFAYGIQACCARGDLDRDEMLTIAASQWDKQEASERGE